MKGFKIKRKSERWVSNNRVLIGSSKKDPGRNPNFDTEETKLLISLWGDPVVQRTLITSHRKYSVIAKLAEKMGEYGYSRSAEEINTRIKNLKCFYNRLKKDLELGAINTATWKHFPAMDEIMTRSIFSVRPNEIPKPSLKYQLEVEKKEQEERNKLRSANTTKAHNTEENNMSYSSDTSEDAELVKNGVQVNCDESTVMEFIDHPDHIVKIKEEDSLSNYETNIEETPLIIPKDEPLSDGDTEIHDTTNEIKRNDGCLTPRVPEYILPNGNTQALAVSKTCRKFVNGNLNNSPQTKVSPTILLANQPNTKPSAGKISLVPTNFLLQQNTGQAQQIQIRQQAQPRIICSQPNVQTNNGMVTSAGAGRMKVLLVNAFQNGQQTANVPTTLDASFPNPSIITTANVHKTNVQDSMGSKKLPETSSRTEETTSNKDIGTEMLFNKLIAMQTENNEIQKQRLEIEKQRFEFEKTIADKLLTALLTLSQPQRSNLTIASNTVQTSNERGQPLDLIEDSHSFQLLIPKVEKMD